MNMVVLESVSKTFRQRQLNEQPVDAVFTVQLPLAGTKAARELLAAQRWLTKR